MEFDFRKISVQDAKRLANKCLSKNGISFKQGAEKTDWFKKNKPPVEFYEVTFDSEGVGLLAGRRFGFGNSYYFNVNELGKYKSYRDGHFAPICFDSINLWFGTKGVVFQAANDELFDYYLSIGAVSISNTHVSREMEDVIDTVCDLFYESKKVLKHGVDYKSPVLEYLGTYSGNSGVGTNGGGSGRNPYFIYQILDLNSSLSQKGNTTAPKKFHLLIGDKIKGVCALDNKEHTGVIQSFYVDGNSKDMKPTYIYILDEQSVLVPLFPKTIVKLVNRSRGAVSSQSEMNGQFPGLF